MLITGAKSLGQSLPNLDGVATAGGSAVTIFQVIDTVNMHSVSKIYCRYNANNNTYIAPKSSIKKNRIFNRDAIQHQSVAPAMHRNAISENI